MNVPKPKITKFAFPLCIGIILGLLGPLELIAQESKEESAKKAPSLLMVRAEENYAYLKDKNPYQPEFGDRLKYLALNQSRSIYLSLGGEYRSRIESFTNRNWTTKDEAYYSQRLALNANLQVGKSLRVFAEIYHGLTSGEERFLEDDPIDLFQGFVEWIPYKNDKQSLSIRAGRQEFGFGASRLTGIREGPNIRRSFDMGRFIYRFKNSSLNLLYGKEVRPGFSAFDNQSQLFTDNSPGNPLLWGLYSQIYISPDKPTFDFYYLIYQSAFSSFNDVMGKENRHTVGLRSNGRIGKLSFNTELIYQFGQLASSEISAFNFETDWQYQLSQRSWLPKLGLKLDFSSGDKQSGDGKIQTFNPLFVNPAIYSLAAVNTPANISSFHPNFSFSPIKKLRVYLDYAVFYRSQENDGLYAPPNFQTRKTNGIKEKHIGDVIGLELQYRFNRNIFFNLRSSYFIAGNFIKASGPAKNTFYIAPTLSLKF